jgi:hypothetical protein
MSIQHETLITPSGGMLERDYQWQGWLYKERTGGWDVNSTLYMLPLETVMISSPSYNSGQTPWICEGGAAEGRLRVKVIKKRAGDGMSAADIHYMVDMLWDRGNETDAT